MRDPITSFRNEHDFLSNFYEAVIQWDGRTYRNNEAAFQSAKTFDPQLRDSFSWLDAAAAKRKGRQIPLRPDWEDVKVAVMEEVVRAKFQQHPELAWRLIATGDAPLVEGNRWHDTFWGVDAKSGKGENHLGIILMAVREELRAKETSDAAEDDA